MERGPQGGFTKLRISGLAKPPQVCFRSAGRQVVERVGTLYVTRKTRRGALYAEDQATRMSTGFPFQFRFDDLVTRSTKNPLLPDPGRSQQGPSRGCCLSPPWIARGMNSGQRVSAANDSTWNPRPSAAAARHGPCPVAYWSRSIWAMVSSLDATVVICPWRLRVTLRPCAADGHPLASATTRRNAASTTRRLAGMAAIRVRSDVRSADSLSTILEGASAVAGRGAH